MSLLPEELQKAREERIRNIYGDGYFEKGKALPPGSERNWGGTTYVKQSDGKWKVKSKNKDKKEKTVSDIFDKKEIRTIEAIAGIGTLNKEGGKKELREIKEKLENKKEGLTETGQKNKKKILDKLNKFV